jgi:hypothetical protein
MTADRPLPIQLDSRRLEALGRFPLPERLTSRGTERSENRGSMPIFVRGHS